MQIMLSIDVGQGSEASRVKFLHWSVLSVEGAVAF